MDPAPLSIGTSTPFVNGLVISTHFTTAPEETIFLYQEIFEHRVYFQHGINLSSGDTVVDVGSNVGMFAVYAELLFPTAAAMNIIAVEPLHRNFLLLEQNLSKYVPHALLIEAAVGVGGVGGVGGVEGVEGVEDVEDVEGEEGVEGVEGVEGIVSIDVSGSSDGSMPAVSHASHAHTKGGPSTCRMRFYPRFPG